MIAVAVVGIVSSIAYPSYVAQVRKSRQADAQAALMNIAARQQQMLLDTRSYADSVATLNVTLPIAVVQNYAVTITVGTATVPTFTATATPAGAQLAGACGVLSINQTGTKLPPSCW